MEQMGGSEPRMAQARQPGCEQCVLDGLAGMESSCEPRWE
jgi:hypothetical protein